MFAPPEHLRSVLNSDVANVPLTRLSQDVIPQTDRANIQFLNLVQKLLAFDPNQRITVREALNHPYFSLNIPEEI